MDNEIEDLESLLSEHFGRTPCSTPWGSQEDGACLDDLADVSGESDTEEVGVNVDQRARAYIEGLLEDGNEDTNQLMRETGHHEERAECSSLLQEDEDMISIIKVRENGCGCKKNCITHFTDSDLFNHILNVKDMEKQDKEMYVMATLVGSYDKETTKRGKKRQRGRHDFSLLGKTVCKTLFMLAFDVKRTCLQNLIAHVNEHGVEHRIHGNKGRKPTGSLQFEDIKYAVTYISATAEEVGLPQPAAPRGTDNIPPIYLPSHTTKLEIHSKYQTSCEESDPRKRPVHYKTFCSIWKQCLPHIKIATPRDDVCATCEKIRKCIMDARTEEEKLESSALYRNHILKAQKERDIYNTCVAKARKSSAEGDIRNVHFTFDFSQNVSLPHHSRQMGPVFFLSLRKVQLFGVRNDGTPKQYNFLIDENETIGEDGTQSHGPNSVISMLHWAIEQDHAGEKSIKIHADNCPDQNKNLFVLGYMMWRVLTGRHEQIEYQMQIPGHSRCHVDAGFAAAKRLYRRTDTDTIAQLEAVINKSSGSNVCVRYPAWSWRDWKSFLRPCFKPIPGIRKYQYFRIEKDRPGSVTVKESCDAEEKHYNILRSNDIQFHQDQLPHMIQPAGLSAARHKYLYSTVRPYVRPAYQDVTCPPPDESYSV